MTSRCLPQFIIAGAPRTATTWLYELADRHPQIAMARPLQPEPKFFLIDDLYAKGLDFYSHQWFAALPKGRIFGEKSTNYLESATAAKRIACDLPAVKLVFLLRNPVDRAYSNYTWSVRNGMEQEPFEMALSLEQERERTVAHQLRYARPHAYFSRGLYADMLAPWFALFSKDQILVLRTEDVSEKPAAVADTLFRFIGVDPGVVTTEGLGIINASRPDGGPPMSQQTRRQLEERYREPNLRLAQLLDGTFSLWNETGQT